MNSTQRICDYEGSDYKERFWDKANRSYEDQSERHAIRRMLPPRGDTLIDIGAGFGRLVAEFAGYERVVLFDYSRSLLGEARELHGGDPRFIYVAGNWYKMPFVDGLFDALVQVRTIHHAASVPELFTQLARISAPGSAYVLEFANKRNLKAIVRYLLGRQDWSPYSREPIEFAEMNFDFHPDWMRLQLEKAAFSVQRTRTVSYFRQALLKRVVPTGLLLALERAAQRTSGLAKLSPSLFHLSHAPGARSDAGKDGFFACPDCAQPLGAAVDDVLECLNAECGHKWAIRDGVYDFKEAVR